MKFFGLLSWAAVGISGSPIVLHPFGNSDSYPNADVDSGKVLGDVAKYALTTALGMLDASKGATCTKDTVRVRKEWRNIPAQERRDYVAAVECLQRTPSAYPIGVVPGAAALFDDLTVVHWNQTATNHWTATFLPWHRFFTWTYEQKLRDVCGYRGAFPYWEWGLDVADPVKSPLFDGSSTSIGSDGAPVKHGNLMLVPPGDGTIISLAPGSGGGCVMRGPFSNMTVHLGPQELPVYGSTEPASAHNPLLDNPRCLKRDLSASAGQFASFRNMTRLVLDNHNIEWFQAFIQGTMGYVSDRLSVHGGIHYVVGGDPGGDFFFSSGDPAFFLLHSNVDRLYWIWQMLDFASRQEIFGTHTLYNDPPSANATLEDTIDLHPLNPAQKVGSLMSTLTGHPFCYIYE